MSKKIDVIVILIIIIIVGGLVCREYYGKYSMCVEFKYPWPVDCTEKISFIEYAKEYSIIKAIKNKDVTILDKLILSSPLIAVVISLGIYFKNRGKNKEVVDVNVINLPKLKESMGSDSLENGEKIDNKNKSHWSDKVTFGIIIFLILGLRAVLSSIDGFTFMSSTSYGFEAVVSCFVFDLILFWPITSIGVILIVSGLCDFFTK